MDYFPEKHLEANVSNPSAISILFTRNIVLLYAFETLEYITRLGGRPDPKPLKKMALAKAIRAFQQKLSTKIRRKYK